MRAKVVVLGKGAWGQALSRVVEARGHAVRSHGGLSVATASAGSSEAFELAAALQQAHWVVLAMPTFGLREALRAAQAHLPAAARLVNAAKGIENDTLMLPSEIIADVLGEAAAERSASLSGPSFASEVDSGSPTNVVLAAQDPDLVREAQRLFAGERLRVYTSADRMGVEVGGAVKNVIAVAAGACDGLGFGLNTRAALITRGLAEMARLAVKKGGRLETIAGLAGLGDLILTCTGELSRNRMLGYRIGQGREVPQALAGLSGVAEGYRTAKSVFALARALGVDAPICEQVYRVLYEGRSAKAAVQALLKRPLGSEWE